MKSFLRAGLPLGLLAMLVVFSSGCADSEVSSAPATANIKRTSAVEVEKQSAPQHSEAPAAASAKQTSAASQSPSTDSKNASGKNTEPTQSGTTADPMLAELHKLDQVRLEEDTPEARAKFVEVQKQILTTADQVLAKPDLKEDSRLEVVGMKWYAALLLVKLGDSGAEERFLALANELTKDKNPTIAKSARVQLQQLEIMQALSDLLQGKAKNADKLVQNLSAMLGEEGLRYGQLDLARNAARVLEATGKYDEATQVYAGISKAFGSSSDAELAAQAEQVARTAKIRLGLIGKEAELKGTRLDGQPFDFAELKGKVVLVDFWATWCGPCMQELPNVVDNYKKYHDRGFEVVGISLDTDKDRLTRFVAGENELKEKLPWTTLHSSEATAQSDPFDGLLAKQFGVDGIPATFLVDQQGKVIALSVRGERLGEKLAELLGPADDIVEK
jgi:thiol-disulfide isomerase/thioredoxin